MKFWPIIFSAPMIRAIQAGKKTQTRRLIRTRKRRKGDEAKPAPGSVSVAYASWTVGDRLWVRETWYDDKATRETEPAPAAPDEYVHYRADGEAHEQFEDLDGFAWRPPIYMPRWASRITLAVLAVRFERLWAIDTAGIAAEGLPVDYSVNDNPGVLEGEQRVAFRNLWNKINGERAAWEENPWVRVTTFAVQA